MKIGIIIGSTRQSRIGKTVATWVKDHVPADSTPEVSLLDLVDFPLPFLDSAILPSGLNKKYPHTIVQDWSKIIDGLEAIIIVTPEYNHGYPAVLKNALDWLWSEWANKPAGIVSYSAGIVGGVRAAEQLRGVLAHLSLRTAPTSVAIGNAPLVLTNQDSASHIQSTLEKMVEEMKSLTP